MGSLDIFDVQEAVREGPPADSPARHTAEAGRTHRGEERSCMEDLPTFKEYMDEEAMRLEREVLDGSKVSPFEMLGVLSHRLGVSLPTACKRMKEEYVKMGICREDQTC